MQYKKLPYEAPCIREPYLTKGLSLLANLSLESDFEDIDFEDF